MKAITLWQPWAWCIAHNDKRIENRGWAPPARIIGERIAIHAGKKFDQEVADHLLRNGVIVPEEVALGAFVATAMVTGYATTALDAKRADQSFWWQGPYGWHLEAVVTLPEPLQCKGAQGLWTVPDEIEALMLTAEG